MRSDFVWIVQRFGQSNLLDSILEGVATQDSGCRAVWPVRVQILHHANVPMAAPLASDGPQRFGRSSNGASIVLDIDSSKIRHDHHGTVAILARSS